MDKDDKLDMRVSIDKSKFLLSIPHFACEQTRSIGETEPRKHVLDAVFALPAKRE